MEADSTTHESNSKSTVNEICLPFNSSPSNLELYKDFISNDGKCHLESQIVEKLQSLGLIPITITCPENRPDCKVVCKSARVIDRVQWVCEGCGKRQPIRAGSFFFKLQCSILQTLQLILAWCEDADLNIVAQYFDIKLRVATAIYDKLDLLAISEFEKTKLGGDGTVVLSEIYPDCFNRLSPDTTDHPHVHRILMLADTKQIPTRYKLHVIQEDLKKFKNNTNSDQSLKDEVERVLSRATEPRCTLVAGSHVPLLAGAVPLQQLLQHCDVDMQHFLSSRIWKQAVALCAASRELCVAPQPACARAVQRYLDAAAYRLRHGDGFYRHTLRLIAGELAEPLPS